MQQANKFKAIVFKEFKEFFSLKFSWIFFVSFTFASGALTFYAGDLFAHNVAETKNFFIYQSYLYIFFLPILSMNIWQKERSQKTMEWLLSLGAKNATLVLAKFTFLFSLFAILLSLTIPIFLSFEFLGNIQTRMALSGYLACFLLGLTYLSIGQFTSFVIKNQALAFMANLSLIFLFSATSFEKILYALIENSSKINSFKLLEFSFSENFLTLVKGNLSLSSLMFFISAIGVFLVLNSFALNYDKFRN